MATFYGFISALEVRDDGWVDVELSAPHAGDARRTFHIRSLDGDVTQNNRRLAQLGLLRDALARSQPVEIDYDADNELGDLIREVRINPRASLSGRTGGRRVEGVVIGFANTERTPVSAAVPYLDPPDLGAVAMLTTDGGFEQAVIDLQRPDVLAAQGMMAMLMEAHRTRRPIALTLASSAFSDGKLRNTSAGSTTTRGQYVVACEYPVVAMSSLAETYAFIERLGQRYESIDIDNPLALSHVRVQYTTTPGQTPEGDVSDNGSFAPHAGAAWVHDDSPLLTLLEAALRDGLMVRLGIFEDTIHEVIVVSHLGSAARPVWIDVRRRTLPPPDDAMCENTPTIQLPTADAFEALPTAVAWTGDGYFNEGIWRFAVEARSPVKLTIDGSTPCGALHASPATDLTGEEVRDEGRGMYHAYLKGVHRLDVVLSGRRCQEPFRLLVYRIR